MPFLRALAGSLIALSLTVGVCDAKSKKHVSDDDNQSAEQGDAGDDGSSDTDDKPGAQDQKGKSFSSTKNSAATFTDDKPSTDKGQKGKSFSNTKNGGNTFGVPSGESLSNKGNSTSMQPGRPLPPQELPGQPKNPK